MSDDGAREFDDPSLWFRWSFRHGAGGPIEKEARERCRNNHGRDRGGSFNQYLKVSMALLNPTLMGPRQDATADNKATTRKRMTSLGQRSRRPATVASSASPTRDSGSAPPDEESDRRRATIGKDDQG